MQTYDSKALAGLLFLTTATSLFGQGAPTLIGPSSRNGSFEDGVLAPWTVAAGSTSLLQDSNFATDGEWLAVVSDYSGPPPPPPSRSIVRPSIYHRVTADRNDGLTFAVTLDAGNGVAAYEGIRVFFAAQNFDASYAFATNVFFDLLPLGWQSLEAEFRLPELWDGGGSITLGLQFENVNAAADTTYMGYLDNVVLQQIPEPSTLALMGLGGLCVFRRILRDRKVISASSHP